MIHKFHSLNPISTFLPPAGHTSAPVEKSQNCCQVSYHSMWKRRSTGRRNSFRQSLHSEEWVREAVVKTVNGPWIQIAKQNFLLKYCPACPKYLLICLGFLYFSYYTIELYYRILPKRSSSGLYLSLKHKFFLKG